MNFPRSVSQKDIKEMRKDSETLPRQSLVDRNSRSPLRKQEQSKPQTPTPNHVAQKDYAEKQGHRSSSDEERDIYGRIMKQQPSYVALGDRDPHHRRRQIRKNLLQKRSKKAPALRWTKFMHSETKNNIVAVIGEFIGTTTFLFFAFAGTQLANIVASDSSIVYVDGAEAGFNPATTFYISVAFGMSLLVNAWVFFRISGGLFNPAVTLAICLLGGISPLRAWLLFISQMGGACFSAYLVQVMFPTPFSVQTDLSYGTSHAQGVFIEALCTAMLVFTIIMLAVEKHRATFMAPIPIGMALFISELCAVTFTGGSLNPARSFGPAAVQHLFHSSHWVYWVGPFIGTILAVACYKLFKFLEYELVNPGQDGDVENDPTQNPEHSIAQVVEERQAEVEEIRVIEQNGGFNAFDASTPRQSVLGPEGVVGMAIDGVREGDEVHLKRVRSGEPDLEAGFPAHEGMEEAVDTAGKFSLGNILNTFKGKSTKSNNSNKAMSDSSSKTLS